MFLGLLRGFLKANHEYMLTSNPGIKKILYPQFSSDTWGISDDNAPLGQIEAHPLRMHDEHGMILSHFNLRLAAKELVSWKKELEVALPVTVCIQRRQLRHENASTLSLWIWLDLLNRYVPPGEWG